MFLRMCMFDEFYTVTNSWLKDNNLLLEVLIVNLGKFNHVSTAVSPCRNFFLEDEKREKKKKKKKGSFSLWKAQNAPSLADILLKVAPDCQPFSFCVLLYSKIACVIDEFQLTVAEPEFWFGSCWNVSEVQIFGQG